MPSAMIKSELFSACLNLKSLLAQTHECGLIVLTIMQSVFSSSDGNASSSNLYPINSLNCRFLMLVLFFMMFTMHF